MTFAVLLERHGAYDLERDLREQSGWDEHAAFSDALVDTGFIRLGGPLEDGVHVLHVVEAEDEAAVRARLAEDPWYPSHLRIEWVQRWDVLLREG